MISIGLAWHLAQHNQLLPSSAILYLPSCPSALSGVNQVGTALAQQRVGEGVAKYAELNTDRYYQDGFPLIWPCVTCRSFGGVRRLPNNSQKQSNFEARKSWCSNWHPKPRPEYS